MSHKKGFVLLETIIVVCVLCVILVILFSAYSSLLVNVHKKSLYDNTEYVYKTSLIRNYLEENTSLKDTIMGTEIYVVCSDSLAAGTIKQCGDSSVEGYDLYTSLNVKAIYLTRWDTDGIDVSSLEATTQKYIKQIDDKRLGDEVYRIVVMFASESYDNPDMEEYQYASLRFGSRENQHTEEEEALPDVPPDSEEPTGPSGPSNTYTITFNANGGSVDTPSKTVSLGKKYGELPIPKKAGQGFVGWFTSQNGGNRVTSNSYLRQASNQTLYAHWTNADVIQKIRNQVKSGTPDFKTPATTDEGVYMMADDYGTSYYFRGAVTNNYVKFAGFYWRIVRVNGNNTLRIMFNGLTEPHPNGEVSNDKYIFTGQKFNDTTNDAKYVGYMYGPAGTTASTSALKATTNTVSSSVKTAIDTWYEESLKTNYDKYISDTLFCNDRSRPGKTNTGFTNDTGRGYGTQITAYGAYARLGNTAGNVVAPIFTCPQKNDAFTVSDTAKGNGALTYPIALVTADEILAAGSRIYSTSGGNNFFHLSTSNSYYSNYFAFTMTPLTSGLKAQVYSFSGRLASIDVTGTYSPIFPVINIKEEYARNMNGDGTIDSPYEIIEG